MKIPKYTGFGVKDLDTFFCGASFHAISRCFPQAKGYQLLALRGKSDLQKAAIFQKVSRRLREENRAFIRLLKSSCPAQTVGILLPEKHIFALDCDYFAGISEEYPFDTKISFSADAPSFAEVAPKLLSLLDGCVLVAHNADFDLGFLREEFASCGFRLPDNPVLDTLKLCRKSGRFAKNNLGCVAQQLGINCQGWHRAMADTKMAEQIFYYFLNRLYARGVHTVEDLQKFQFKKWTELICTDKESIV